MDLGACFESQELCFVNYRLPSSTDLDTSIEVLEAKGMMVLNCRNNDVVLSQTHVHDQPAAYLNKVDRCGVCYL